MRLKDYQTSFISLRKYLKTQALTTISKSHKFMAHLTIFLYRVYYPNLIRIHPYLKHILNRINTNRFKFISNSSCGFQYQVVCSPSSTFNKKHNPFKALAARYTLNQRVKTNLPQTLINKETKTHLESPETTIGLSH